MSNCNIVLWVEHDTINATCTTCQSEEETLGSWESPAQEGDILKVTLEHMLTVLRDAARAKREKEAKEAKTDD